MKKNFLITGILASSALAFAATTIGNKTKSERAEVIVNNDKPKPTVNNDTEYSENTIQVALLLDTSNSMDGLIDQAKSRLWNIVNTLTTLKYEGKTPMIQISLYEYGNDGISNKNWVRQVTPLTQDLDLISEKLFALRTNGGTEYCGAVIKDAVDELQWNSNNSNAMKLVYIAGNEAFNQEGINYKEAISDAQKKNIFINTIYCGDAETGIRTFWKDGADVGKGKYFNIDSNRKVVYIATPYDDQISQYNVRLNNTYIGYGRTGFEKKAVQETQDRNAASMSASNAVERTVSKTKKAAYKNDSWDLVDKAESDREYLSKLKEEELPKELKGKSKAEIAAFVETKSKERATLQKEIEVLAVKRQQFIDTETQKRGGSDSDDLGKAIATSIYEIGKMKGFVKN